MLTIYAMAQMGVWLLNRIEVLDHRSENCRRCSTSIRYVWVMALQTDPGDEWRIGSDCGPRLEHMSQELWDKVAEPFQKSLNIMTKLEKLAKWEREFPDCLPPNYVLGWAERERQAIAAEQLTKHQRMVRGHHVSQAEKNFKIKIKRMYGRVG